MLALCEAPCPSDSSGMVMTFFLRPALLSVLVFLSSFILWATASMLRSMFWIELCLDGYIVRGCFALSYMAGFLLLVFSKVFLLSFITWREE